MYYGAALRGSRGEACRKASTHRFCAAKLLALKSIGFLMTGKKKAYRNAPVFQVLFSQHGAKRLTLKRCLLAFLWHSLLFFCRRFLFQIKRKCRNAGSIYRLIIVGREGRGWIIQFHIVPLARHRCVEVAAPYKPRVNKFVQASRTD